ncbi:MAG: LLM class F420-dependent oxidoreductase [Ardenticatenaceae bacterium]|nr:LLM class F420-dependent oxidoreductase [Ardenticatenaceae bacterium]
MRIGVVFPQTEFGSDPGAIKEYAQTAESLGFSHILAYDHVLGANPDRPGGWRGPYTHQSAFHEPFVLYSYMAALTETIEFVTGILILPQRDTVLVAKQAAALDVLSNGRLRLGVGTGWNEVEYIAQNQDFHTRGQRQEEQIELLRLLWTQELVTFNGRWHTIPDAGLNPLPVQQPIPIWLGGYVDAVLRRVARIGDGWMPAQRTAQAAEADLAKLDQYLAENGRTRADIGLEPRLHYKDNTLDSWGQDIADWQDAGATHLSLNTMGAGLTTPQQHIAAIEEFAQLLPS